jgi:hypothetical protein
VISAFPVPVFFTKTSSVGPVVPHATPTPPSPPLKSSEVVSTSMTAFFPSSASLKASAASGRPASRASVAAWLSGVASMDPSARAGPSFALSLEVASLAASPVPFPPSVRSTQSPIPRTAEHADTNNASEATASAVPPVALAFKTHRAE